MEQFLVEGSKIGVEIGEEFRFEFDDVIFQTKKDGEKNKCKFILTNKSLRFQKPNESTIIYIPNKVVIFHSLVEGKEYMQLEGAKKEETIELFLDLGIPNKMKQFDSMIDCAFKIGGNVDFSPEDMMGNSELYTKDFFENLEKKNQEKEDMCIQPKKRRKFK